MISIVILGAGNVGTHLVKAVQAAENLSLIQWYCRDSKAIKLAIKDVELCHDLEHLKLAFMITDFGLYNSIQSPC